jgi:broad specificity phosphatase PhoE
MVEIIFEAHATTLDNEAGVGSGWFDVELSSLGKTQAEELGRRYADAQFDAVFCSDLQRSYTTAEIAFAGREVLVVRDERLRECNYGAMTRRRSSEIEKEKISRISMPFPDGESYEQTTERVRLFLQELLEKYDGKRVLIIGHRATQYALEHIINQAPLETIVPASWKWQPGWTYQLEAIS